MRHNYSLCLTVLFLLFNLPCTKILGQSMLVSDPISIRNDYGYELIGRLRDRILVFRDKYDDFEVQAYDNQLQVSWNKELEDIERRGTQILAVVGSKNDFSIIYKTKRKGNTVLCIHKYDPAANLIDSMTVKNYGDRLFEQPVLDVVKSEDKNCFVVHNTSSKRYVDVVCFRLDKMQVLWDKKIFMAEDYFDSNQEDMTLSNKGDFFIVEEDNNRRTKKDEHLFQVHFISAVAEAIATIPMQDRLTRDVSFVFDNANNQLTAAGLYSEKNRDRANGVFYLNLSPGDTTAKVLKFSAFDDTFISIIRGKEVESDTKGISDAYVQQMVLRRDGGIVMVGEQHYEIQRGASGTRGFWREGVRVIVDYYYNDLFVIAVDPDGKAHWKTVLHKKQYSQDDEGTFSSFFLLKMSDKLRFLFNDEIKYENTCSEYLLSPLGEFDRNSLLNTADQNLRLRFRDGLQLNERECLIPSEYRNKLRLVLLQYK